METKTKLKELGLRHTEHDHSLTADDMSHWDYDTKKIIVEAARPFVQGNIKARMDSPMRALQSIVHTLYKNNADSEDVSKLRYAYQGLAIALGHQLDHRYDKIEA